LLGLIGPNAEEGVPELIDFIKTALQQERCPEGGPVAPYVALACDVLAAIGPRAMRAAPQVEQLLTSREPFLRTSAARALVEMGIRGPKTEAAVNALLRDANPEVRCGTIHKVLASGHLAASAPAIKAELINLLRDPSVDVQLEAAGTVAELHESEEKLIPVLESMLVVRGAPTTRSDPAIRALRLLARLGPRARPAVPRIAEFRARQRGGRNGIAYALAALVAIGGPSEEAGHTLAQIVKADPLMTLDSDFTATLMTAGGPAGLAAIQAIAGLLDRDSGTTRAREMCDLIGDLGRKAAPMVPLLAKMLRDKDSFRRQMAARALGQVGPAARDSLEVLRELATADDVYVRLQARDAIRRIQE
jgi:HEAT repeat protein